MKSLALIQSKDGVSPDLVDALSGLGATIRWCLAVACLPRVEAA